MTQIAEMAFHGQWAALLRGLRTCPERVNEASEGKGYTPLHQAAWHGASLPVIGELLALGADPNLRTFKQQTAQDIALDKHPSNGGLAYLLTPGFRSISQLIRMLIAEQSSLFSDYDGNQIICDRLVELFSLDIAMPSAHDLSGRVEAAIQAVTGLQLHSRSPQAVHFDVSASFDFTTDAQFWSERFIPMLRALIPRSRTAPIGKAWAVVADLFEPAPDQWGLRGDLFLWLEMRHALCHVPLPASPESLSEIIRSTYAAITGSQLTVDAEVWVPHLARGGMSSGMVSGDFWSRKWIPTLQQRLEWLQDSWRFPRE